jgi:hypothetical protein
VIVYGRWLKVATVKVEAWKEGSIVGSPEKIL